MSINQYPRSLYDIVCVNCQLWVKFGEVKIPALQRAAQISAEFCPNFQRILSAQEKLLNSSMDIAQETAISERQYLNRTGAVPEQPTTTASSSSSI
jgi:hypothetical protein